MRAWISGAVIVWGAALVTGCQILSGLDDLREGAGGRAASSSSGADMCGGICEHGACVDGECKPYKLGDLGSRDPRVLAVNETSLFGAVLSTADPPTPPNGEIVRIPLGKTNGTAVVAAASIMPVGLAADSGSIYWLDATPTGPNGMEYRGVLHAIAGGTGSIGVTWASLPSLSAQPESLVMVGKELWYGTSKSTPAIGHVSTSGTPATPAAVAGIPIDLVSDGKSVFYYDGTDIKALTIATGKVATFATMASVRWLAVDADPGGYLYWIARAAGSASGDIVRSPKSSLSIEVVASSRTFPFQIIVDDKFAYWIEGSDCATPGSIQRWKVGDPPGKFTEIGTTESCAALTHDAKHLYWTSGGAAYAKVKP